MSESIDVSIIIAAYNASDFIGRAIDSALAQEGLSIEVIIVDDASPRPVESAVMAAAKNDPRVQFYSLATNQGPSGARNLALQHCKGRYVAVLDADDAMQSNRLKAMTDIADEHSADIVVDDMQSVSYPDFITSDGTFLTWPGDAPTDLMPINLQTYIDPEKSKAFGEPLGYLKPIFRRSFLQDNQLIYDLSLRNSEDHYIVANMLANGARMILLNMPGYLYTQRAGSLSHRLSPTYAKAILDAEHNFTEAHQASFGPDMQKAAKRRWKAVSEQYAFECLYAHLKAKHIPAAVIAFAKQPKHMPHMIGRLFGILVKKLSGRSA